MANSEVVPGTPDGSVNSSSPHKEGPVLCLLNKRIRALRKKYNKILQIEENKSQGKVINKEQEEVLCCKTGIAVLIDELEKLKQPLSNALKEEVAEREREFMDTVLKRPDEDGGSANEKEYSSANDKEHSSANDEGLDNENSDGKGIMVNGCFEETRKECGESSAMDKEAPDLIAVADILKILYFAKLFNVYSLNRLASIMWTKTHERISCLSYDYVTEDATDHLREEDLDALSMIGSFMTSRSPNATISHKDALQMCVHHARQWLCNSDQPIHPNSTLSYSNLRERLSRILSSEYFITTPELKTISHETAAAAATAAGQYVPEVFMHHSSAEDELLQLEHVPNYIQQQDQMDIHQHFYQVEECSNPVETDELSNSVVDGNSFPEGNTPSENVQTETKPIPPILDDELEQNESQHQQLPSISKSTQEMLQHDQHQPQNMQLSWQQKHDQQHPQHMQLSWQQQQYARNGGMLRSSQTQRGGRSMGYGGGGRGRSHMNGRGSRGGRGGSYSDGHEQFHDQGGPSPRNYYSRRGKAGRGAGIVYNNNAAGPIQATADPE